MPAFLVPIHEHNDCHAPAGSPAGGQFCSRDAFVPRPPRKPLPFVRRKASTDDLFMHHLYMNAAERREWRQLSRAFIASNEALVAAQKLERDHALQQLRATRWTPEMEAANETYKGIVQQMRVIEEAAARRAIATIAKELDFPAENITIINEKTPREFMVGGKRWEEGGHYDPKTNRIQVNLHNLNGIALVKLVAHEIAHAKYEVWMAAFDAESERIKQWNPPGAEQTKWGTFFRADGVIYPQFQAAFKREFPAHAATMDTYGSYYSVEPRSLFDQMRQEDGFTDYSKAYWEQSRTDTGGRGSQYLSHTGRTQYVTWFSRAIDETLAEVNAWRVARRMGFVAAADNVPSKPWRKFSAQINQFYRAHGAP